MSEKLNFCRICLGQQVECLSALKNLPTYIWPLSPSKQERFADAFLHACQICGHIQLQNFDEKFIASLYEDYDFINFDSVPKKDRFHRLAAKYSSQELSLAKILDVGGGTNSIIDQFSDSAEKWVVDYHISQQIQEVANFSFLGDFTKVDLPHESFDFIFLFHCLEHMDSPLETLNRLSALLKKGGKAVIEVPNFQHYVDHFPYYAVFHQHLNMFHYGTLVELFAKRNFTVDHVFIDSDVIMISFIKDSYSDHADLADQANYLNHANSSLSNFEYGKVLIEKLKKNLEKIDISLEKFFSQHQQKKAALYGGGGTSKLFMHHYKMYLDKFHHAYDIDKRKQGRFLYHGQIAICDPSNIPTNTNQEDSILYLNKALEPYLPYKDKIHYHPLTW